MSETAASACHTEHALLVLLGQYAQHLGLIKALMAVSLHQQTRTFSPQTKVLEFLVAILAGLPHLEDISRDGPPLDPDQAVAHAWQQAGWADCSGVARTLQVLTQVEAEAIAQVLDAISRPLLDQQVTQALAERDRLEDDGDLTGRPVSNTSTTYPGAAFGHMDDEVRLGYQAAVVSFGSPTYRRLWLSVKPHPGHLLSCQLTEELVQAAGAHTRVRPQRRTDLLGQRLQAAGEQLAKNAHELALRPATALRCGSGDDGPAGLVCLLQRQASHRGGHQGGQRRLPDALSQGPQRSGTLVAGTVCRFRCQLRALGRTLAQHAELPGAPPVAPAGCRQCQNLGAGGCAHTRHRRLAT